MKWKNLLFNLFYQNPSLTPIWDHVFGAPDGGLHARSYGPEGEAAYAYSPARHHWWLKSLPTHATALGVGVELEGFPEGNLAALVNV